MILEAVMLNIRSGQRDAFEAAFRQASPLIAGSAGYLSHELQHSIETSDRYLLLVHWQTLEAHTVGFRGSPAYQEWKALLHNFYEPAPTVEHFEPFAL